MTKKTRVLPPFASYAEEAHFWDTHDSTDLSEIPDNQLTPYASAEKKKRLEEGITIRFKQEDLSQLRADAEKRGVGVTTLIRMLALEYLAQNPKLILNDSGHKK